MSDRMISHYRIVRKLGAGGMGEVLLGMDTRLDRPVALKIMSADLARDAKKRKRFQAEAKAASGLSHPNICVIHEVGETEDGRPFLAMEYVEGQTLDAVARQRRLKISEIINLGLHVAEALDAAHARHLVHRDIKPSNLILDKRGQAKVLDFGLAKRLAGAEEQLATTQLTASGVLIGTPHYMSPEQVLGAELDGRSDIFSLGVVLYELVAGQRPFLGNTIGEVFDHILHQQPEPLGLENPVFSPSLDGIIFKCLEKQPQNRYASAGQLAQDLTALRAEAAKLAAPGPNQKSSAAPAANSTPASSITPAPQLRPRLGKALGIAGLILAALAWYFWTRAEKPPHSSAAREQHPAASLAEQQSVAVLPFDNFSVEKDTDYLSDGLTEEITTALARIPGLRVAARNSAFVFKNRREDLRQVGQTLGVNTVLEGSLQKVGSRLRVTAQLINASNGLHLWADAYDRNVDDIFAVEEDIAAHIAGRFQLAPRNGAAEQAMPRAAANPEAYALYLKGLHAWNKRTKDDLEVAVQLFHQATDKDPSYAAAYAGLALAYVVLPDYNSRPNSDYAPLARAAAAQALAFDPSSAEAHAALGMLDLFAHQQPQAEREFQKAIQLNPNYATVHQWYGTQLRWLNRMDEAGAELRRAEALDPLSPVIKIQLIRWLSLSGQNEAALEEIERGLRTMPHPMFHVARAALLGRMGRCPEALLEAQSLRAAFTNSPNFLGMEGMTYARCGDTATARAILTELENCNAKGYAVATDIAWVHVALGELEPAVDSLEQAFARGEPVEDSIREPELKVLAPLPRYQALLKKLGL